MSAWLQTLLVALTVLAAAALLTVAFATFGAAGGAYERLHERLDGAHLWLDLDPQLVEPDAVRETLAELPNVTAVSDARPTVAARLRLDGRQQWLHLRDWPGAGVEVARTLVVDGRAPEAGEVGVLALDRNLADHHGVAVGERVELLQPDGWRPVEVVGLTVSADMCPAPTCDPVVSHTAPGGLDEAGLLPAHPSDAERLALGLRLADPSAHEATLAAVEPLLPPGSIGTAIDHRFLAEMADTMEHIQSVFLAAFGVVGALAAAFLIANAIGDAVRRQTRQIGLLKAVGFTRAQLMGTYLAHYLGLAALASLVGVGAGTAVAAWALADVAARFGASSGGLPPGWVVVAVPVLVVAIAAVFTLVPVRRAARIDVVTAVRTGTTGVRRRPARLARLPASLGTAIVDLRAQPARTLLTAAGLALAAVTLGFASVVTSTLGALADDPEGGLVPAADLTVERPEVLADGEVRSLLAAEPGVAAVRTERYVPWSFAGQTSRRGAFAVDGDLAEFASAVLDGAPVRRAGEVMVGYGLATEHGLGVGDRLPIQVGGHEVELTVTGTYRALANRGEWLIFHADTLAEVEPAAQPGRYHLLLAEGADLDRVASALAGASGGMLEVGRASSFAQPVLDRLPPIMLGLVAVLAAITLLAVLTTVWAAVQERTRELGLLKAVGMSGPQVVASVLAGVAGMAALGYLVGVPGGLLLTGMLLDGLGRNLGFGPIQPTVEPLQLALVLPLLLVVALLGALLPAQRAARLGVAEALRTD